MRPVDTVRYLHQLQTRIDAQQSANLLRKRLVVDAVKAGEIVVDGESLVNFSSNDYLGLASNRDVKDALIQGVTKYGAGASASHLICGHQSVHQQLEYELAKFTGAESVVLFSNGYMANQAVITTLVDRYGVVVADKLNHASLVDGAILSKAKLSRYRHLDLDHAEQKLKSANAEKSLLVSDSVFSMDGDLADTTGLQKLSETYDVPLLLDDAHGFGVLGQGAGVRACHSLNDHVIVMGTLGKAVGVFGAFVAGPRTLTEAMIQFARTYIYTTAIPPGVALAALKSIQIMQADTALFCNLYNNIHYFRQLATAANIPVMQSNTPIQPILVGEADRALRISTELRKRGYLLTAIRPPTVPMGSSRLRLTLSSSHSAEHIEEVVKSLADALDNEY